jgi:peptidyl-prolyl cis-trans isomerase SurA
VLIHSISNSSTKNSGEIGWVNENSLNFEIRSILRNLNISNHTNPITVPGGFLILRIDDIKIVENKDFNIDKKLEEIVRSKRNEQLNNYSNIYYNKIRKENQIDEEF